MLNKNLKYIEHVELYNEVLGIYNVCNLPYIEINLTEYLVTMFFESLEEIFSVDKNTNIYRRFDYKLNCFINTVYLPGYCNNEKYEIVRNAIRCICKSRPFYNYTSLSYESNNNNKLNVISESETTLWVIRRRKPLGDYKRVKFMLIYVEDWNKMKSTCKNNYKRGKTDIQISSNILDIEDLNEN